MQFDGRTHLWAYIDKTGTKVIEPKVSYPFTFREGLVEYYGEQNGVGGVPLGYLDKSGKQTIRVHQDGMRLEFLLGFFEGLARVAMAEQNADGGLTHFLYGYIDHSGAWAIQRSFAAAEDFHDGLAAATEDSIWGYIDKSGHWAILPRFQAALDFYDGLAAVKMAGRWGFIDRNGAIVIAPQFENYALFHEGMAMILIGHRFGYINKTGNVVVAPTFDSASDFQNGVAAVKTGTTYEVIDKTGRVICHLDTQKP